MEQLLLLGVLLAAAVAIASLWTHAGLSRGIQRLETEMEGMARAQEAVRQELSRVREASLTELADATQGIRDQIGQAQRALAEVKALDQGRARQLERATESLRRLEAVVAGSASRGAAGENILAQGLAQLPPDLIETNLAFESKVVEYALRLPDGRVLPIDSKWTGAAQLERLSRADDPEEQRRLVEQLLRELRVRVREMAKYLDPERTLSLGLLAIPDAAYSVASRIHGEAYRQGILVVPYSLALPYVLALYRLVLRFGPGAGGELRAERLRALEESLRRIDDEIEGRLSRSLVQLGNARDALREQLSSARRAAAGLLESGEADRSAIPAPGPRID